MSELVQPSYSPKEVREIVEREVKQQRNRLLTYSFSYGYASTRGLAPRFQCSLEGGDPALVQVLGRQIEELVQGFVVRHPSTADQVP